MTVAHSRAASPTRAGSGSQNEVNVMTSVEHRTEIADLGRLIGTWRVSDPSGAGAVEGQVTFEWLQGRSFIVQRVDLVQNGQRTRGIEVIGHAWPFGGERSPEVSSRFYDEAGHTLDYVYELEGETLTIWGGEKGSPASFRGAFDPSGDRLVGGWVWPGGGYQSSMTRVRP